MAAEGRELAEGVGSNKREGLEAAWRAGVAVVDTRGLLASLIDCLIACKYIIGLVHRTLSSPRLKPKTGRRSRGQTGKANEEHQPATPGQQEPRAAAQSRCADQTGGAEPDAEAFNVERRRWSSSSHQVLNVLNLLSSM